MANSRTAPSRAGAGEGTRHSRVITDVITILESASGTGDAATLLGIQTPVGGGVPAHAQRYEDEAIYVLAGTYSVLFGDRVVEMTEGDSLFIPRGTSHGYANPGPDSARMLVFLVPGGIHEQFLDEVGDHVDRPAWEPDMAKVLAVAPKYGITFATTDGE